jgi:hypothetical protein
VCGGVPKVTIPSQIRFVEYIERLKIYGPVPHVSLALRSLIIHTVPKALTSKIRHHCTPPHPPETPTPTPTPTLVDLPS